MEFPSILCWTPDWLVDFQNSRQYDLNPCLPIVPYNITYILESSSARTTEMVLNDFLVVLDEGYYEYLDCLDNWSMKYRLHHSCQPA
jgi:hypothetical protein